MRTSGRADRRHHVQRLKHKRKHYWGYPNKYAVSALDRPPVAPKEMDAYNLGRVVTDPHPCSCPGCGNPRRHSWFKGERITLQEHRYLDQYREQVNELTEETEEDE